MAKKKKNLEGAYLLKLVLYVVVASQWLRIYTNGNMVIPIPIGALLAVMFASHDHFQIDRKIEYAVILVAMFMGFWLPMGAELVLH